MVFALQGLLLQKKTLKTDCDSESDREVIDRIARLEEEAKGQVRARLRQGFPEFFPPEDVDMNFEVDDEDAEVVSRLLNSAGDQDEIVIRFDTDTVQLGNIQTLRNEQWLSDEVINHL